MVQIEYLHHQHFRIFSRKSISIIALHAQNFHFSSFSFFLLSLSLSLSHHHPLHAIISSVDNVTIIIRLFFCKSSAKMRITKIEEEI